MDTLDEIRRNAQNGLSHCQGCPAHAATDGEFVNPGLFNYNSDIMFVTMDPSHDPHWDRHDTWEEYNEECSERFRNWSGYEPLNYLLEPFGMTVEDAWLADSIKCPVDNSRRRVGDQEISNTFEHCRHYLRKEIDEVNPELIVTFGAVSGERVLAEYHDIQASLSPGHADCGRTFSDVNPPVIISPHWFHGWLGRKTDGERNIDIVRKQMIEIYG